MTQAAFAEDLKKKLLNIKENISKEFYYLEAEQLNLKPGENRWSAIQCVEHINLTNHIYIRNFQKVLSNTPSGDFKNTSIKSGIIGRLMTVMMRPKNGVIKYKSKTFDQLVPLTVKDPKARLLEHVVFENFMSDLDELVRLLDQAVDYPMSKMKVPSFAKGVKFRVADAFAFLHSHMERHLLQAQNAIKGL